MTITYSFGCAFVRTTNETTTLLLTCYPYTSVLNMKMNFTECGLCLKCRIDLIVKFMFKDLHPTVVYMDPPHMYVSSTPQCVPQPYMHLVIPIPNYPQNMNVTPFAIE